MKAGAALNYVVLGLNSLVGLLYTPYLLRMLGQSEYGLYSLVASVVAYLTIMDFGFGNAIIRYTARFRAEGNVGKQESMFGMFAIIYSVIGLVAMAAGLVLVFNVDSLFSASMTQVELSRARTMLLILTFNLAFTFPLSIFGSIITAYEDFIFQKLVQIARILLNTAVMICLLHLGYKAIAMVLVQTAFNLATLLLNFFRYRHKVHIKFRFNHFDLSLLKEVALYSFWIFLGVIIDRIYWSTGQFVLGAMVGTAAVAVFAVAINLQSMYMSFSTAISNVFLPRVSSMVSKNCSDSDLSDLFIRTGRIQYVVLSFILSGFIVFGRQFIAIWAGEGYEDSYLIALMFFLSLTVPLIQNLGITILQAKNQMKFRSLLYIGIALCSLVFQVLLARPYGGVGVAAAVSGALFLGQGVIMNIYYYKKQHLDIPAFWLEILKLTVIPALMCIAGYLATSRLDLSSLWFLAFAITLYSIIYILLMWFFGLSDKEKSLFRFRKGQSEI